MFKDTVKNSVRNVDILTDVHLMMYMSHKNLFSKKEKVQSKKRIISLYDCEGPVT